MQKRIQRTSPAKRVTITLDNDAFKKGQAMAKADKRTFSNLIGFLIHQHQKSEKLAA